MDHLFSRHRLNPSVDFVMGLVLICRLVIWRSLLGGFLEEMMRRGRVEGDDDGEDDGDRLSKRLGESLGVMEGDGRLNARN